MFTFLYKLKACYDTQEEERCGIVVAGSFREATEIVEDYFGDELVEISMEVFDTSLFTLDAKYHSLLKKELEEYCV